tara:strand:- start:665 stop:895 length:231 start_codon:yes stop_codon:yes gene_type:complete
MKLTKTQLKRIIKEELEEVYKMHLTTDDVEGIYRGMGKPAPVSFYDIKMIAQAYESGITGETELRRDIQSGTVKGI